MSIDYFAPLKIVKLIKSKDWDKYTQLLKTHDKTDHVSECSCGCATYNNLRKTLHRHFGYIDAKAYQIAYQTGHLDPNDIDFINEVFWWFSREGFLDVEIHPEMTDEVWMKNTSETIDVFLECCSEEALLTWKHEYKGISQPLSHRILYSQQLEIAPKFNQQMILKLINFGIDFGEKSFMMLRHDIIDDDGANQGNFVKCSPYAHLIRWGYTWLLKTLYDLEPERVKNVIKDEYEMALKEYQDMIQCWKNSYPSITIEKENDDGYMTTIYVEHPSYYDENIDEWKEEGLDKYHVCNDGSYKQPSQYELYHPDEDEKYAAMCELVESIIAEQQ